MSRTIFAVVLAAGLALAVGCGSKPESTLPKVSVEGEPTPAVTPPPADPNSGTPKVEPPKLAPWELDPDKHAIPATAVRGTLAGADFVPEVVIEGEELVFRTMQVGPPLVERKLSLRLAPMLLPGQPAPPVLGRNWKVKYDSAPGPAVPEVWIDMPGKGIFAYQTGYSLTLELGQRKDGKVPGKIYLSVVDEGKTVLAGTFEAVYSRPLSERPGPDEGPFVVGEVALTDAKPGAELRVGYVGFTKTDVCFPEFKQPYAIPPGVSVPPTNAGTSRFMPGDGAGRPFRYEHLKLAPGRYLFTAAVSSGPTVWKWVDVADGTALTENIAIDTTKTGGIEVSVPPGVTGTVYFAPSDTPDKPALEADLFRSFALHVARQGAEIVGGKAILKNLSPGKYEVRAGDLRGFVEVVAGKTAELAMTPPKK